MCDNFAMTLLQLSSRTAGLLVVPRGVCWHFLHKSGNEMTCSHKIYKRFTILNALAT